ncbi:hypothetical protein RSAG8_00082, partial [Rhizoctonia solani AG-8 WAC10335]
MSRSQRAGDGAPVATASGPPPASSSRYHRSSIRSQKGPGLGSSSTRVQVVGERGYDSEIPRELGGMASVSGGYHTEGQASTTTKRASEELLRNVVDPRRNGRLSSMPAQHPSHAHPHEYHLRPELLDDPADRGSSTRRVRKDKEKERRHHDREQRDPTDPVPPSVWLNQLNATEAKRARRTSGSRTRHEDPQQFQHDPRAARFPQIKTITDILTISLHRMAMHIISPIRLTEMAIPLRLALQMTKEPTPPTVQPLRRQRTASGRSITAQPTPPPPPAIPVEAERDEDLVLYQRTPEPATIDSARTPQAPVTSPPIQARVDILRMPGEPLPQGLAMFASRPEMTSSGITPAGVRTEMTQVPGPRADLTNEISRGVETLRAAGEVAPVPVPLPAARRGSLLDEERTRKYSAATEGGASASGSGSRRPSGATDEQRRPVVRAEDQPHRRPSPNHAIVATAARKSIASDASGDSFQSAQLGGSTTMDFQSARDAMSTREAMSPMSNYHSIAPSVRSDLRDLRVTVAANEARVLSNEAREARNPDIGTIVQPNSKMTAPAKRTSGILPSGHAAVASPPAHPGVAFPLANVISPPPAPANVISPSISKERALSRATPVPATPITAPKPVEPEVPTRPRIPSNNMLGSPPDIPGQHATVDAHVPAPAVPADEEGRIRGPPPVASTMPARTNRASLTTHAQTQPEASAVPKGLQQTHQVGGSKESLPETLNSTKASKSKNSKWWKPAPKAPSPTPTPAPPGASQPRQRNTSMLAFLPGSSRHKAQKPSESAPALPPQPHSQPQPYGNEMYNYESTPSSTTLDHDQEQP